MRSDLAVFILTHERANGQYTLDLLRKMECGVEIYLIVDDSDRQLDLYKEKYGDSVIVFSKSEIEESCDTFINWKEWGTPLYARNASYEIARKMGLRYIFMCDDDISRFTIRVVKENVLKGFKIADIDDLLDKMADIMERTGTKVLGFSQEGAYVGGAESEKYKAGCQRTCSQAMMIDVNCGVPWRGIFGEDLHFALDNGAEGNVVLSTMLVSIKSPERTTNSGGLNELYNNSGMYTALFYSVISHPSVVKVNKSNGVYGHRIRRTRIAPMILSDAYRVREI